MLDKTNKTCFIHSKSSNNSDLSFLKKKKNLNKNKIKNCVNKKYTTNRNKKKVKGGGAELTTKNKKHTSKQNNHKKKLLKYNILDKTANCDAHAKFKDFSIDYILK